MIVIRRKFCDSRAFFSVFVLTLLCVSYFPIAAPWMHHHHLATQQSPVFDIPNIDTVVTEAELHSCVCVSCVQVQVNPPTQLIQLSNFRTKPSLEIYPFTDYVPTLFAPSQNQKRGPPAFALSLSTL
jgi:hypothetical protein